MDQSINSHIFDFIEYYAQDERSAGFAVFVEGPWGCGKTHLIEKFLERFEGKSLRVSLYGITSTRQIDDEFYRLLHPVLSSRTMRMAGFLARGLAKGALKIDLAGNNGESISVGVPDIDLKEFQKGPNDRLLISTTWSDA